MSEGPVISVIAPTRNRSAAMANLLASLSRCSDSGFPWELVVVDNGSSDDTEEVVRRAADTLPGVAFKYVEESVPGLHAARHRGTREAAADVLVFVDDDIEVSPSWLPALRDEFLDARVELVGGPSLPKYAAPPPSWIEWTWKAQPDGTRWCGSLSLLESGPVRHEIDPIFVWGLNFAIRKSTLERLRGFHPDALPWDLRRWRGDGETGLSLKARAAGVKAWYCPQALVYHDVPESRLTEEYFWRRSVLQGISDSFTAIRAHGGLAASHETVPIRSRLRRLAGNAIHPRRLRPERGPSAELARLMEEAHAEGYAFHRAEVASDAALLTWVLREDYMEDADPRMQVAMPGRAHD